MGSICANGGGTHLTEEQKMELNRLKQMDAKLQKHGQSNFKKNVDRKKILMLGAGEAGKSTIVRQFQNIYGKGFTPVERKYFAFSIRQNIVESMSILCFEHSKLAARLRLTDKKITELKPDNVKYLEMFIEQRRNSTFDILELTPELTEACIALWEDPAIQYVFSRRGQQIQIIDTFPYFMDRIKIISSDDYEPINQDVFNCRIRTTGLQKFAFETKEGVPLLVVDVGGQVNERRKWIHCFSNVTAIIFVASLIAYNRLMNEDKTTNRMLDTLQLFESVINLPAFKDTSVILFLNKTDLFKEMIKEVPLTTLFPEYTGGESMDAVLDFLAQVFSSLRNPTDSSQGKGSAIYPHMTCATDTNNIAFVGSAVMDLIISKCMIDTGLL